MDCEWSFAESLKRPQSMLDEHTTAKRVRTSPSPLWAPGSEVRQEAPKACAAPDATPTWGCEVGASIAASAAQCRPAAKAGGRIVGTMIVPMLVEGTGVSCPPQWASETATMINFGAGPTAQSTLVNAEGRLLQPTGHVAIGPNGELLQPYGPILRVTDVGVQEAFGY